MHLDIKLIAKGCETRPDQQKQTKQKKRSTCKTPVRHEKMFMMREQRRRESPVRMRLDRSSCNVQ